MAASKHLASLHRLELSHNVFTFKALEAFINSSNLPFLESLFIRFREAMTAAQERMLKQSDLFKKGILAIH